MQFCFEKKSDASVLSKNLMQLCSENKSDAIVLNKILMQLCSEKKSDAIVMSKNLMQLCSAKISLKKSLQLGENQVVQTTMHVLVLPKSLW